MSLKKKKTVYMIILILYWPSGRLVRTQRTKGFEKRSILSPKFLHPR